MEIRLGGMSKSMGVRGDGENGIDARVQLPLYFSCFVWKGGKGVRRIALVREPQSSRLAARHQCTHTYEIMNRTDSLYAVRRSAHPFT